MKHFVFSLILCLFSFSTASYSQDITPKEERIQLELSNNNLPALPEKSEGTITPKDTAPAPAPLAINSTEVIKKEKTVPNGGDPYFTFSGGLAPYQASIGVLKYFIPEWWGQIDINLTFLPSIPVDNYYTATDVFKSYVAFRLITGYSFYSYRFLELSLFAQIQLAFISATDIPIMTSFGFRIAMSFFYLDIGAMYAFTIGVAESDKSLFKGWFPAITVGFRF